VAPGGARRGARDCDRDSRRSCAAGANGWRGDARAWCSKSHRQEM